MTDIKKIREQLDMTQEQFAQELGTTVRTIQNWEAGKVIPKSKEALINKLIDINEHSSRNISTYEEKEGYDSHLVPLLPVSAMAGSLMGFSESMDPSYCQKIRTTVDGAEWAIQLSGDSMEPKYHSGMYILIKKMTGSFIPWGQALVLDTYDGIVLKEIYPSDDEDYIEAHSTNPKYPPFKIEKSMILGVYKVLSGFFINSTI